MEIKFTSYILKKFINLVFDEDIEIKFTSSISADVILSDGKLNILCLGHVIHVFYNELCIETLNFKDGNFYLLDKNYK